MIALSRDSDSDERHRLNTISYDFLAFSAPMFWMRMMLYLDGFQFFGAMLVILKVMMKESVIFFALLFVVLVGFLQGFVGMDQTDQQLTAVGFIVQQMINAIMGDPSFDVWDDFQPPFGLILYYIYNFVIIVILLNVLIALYNSAYEDITSNAIDEYLALFSEKTMQYVRAPDENVYIAPFNLIEIFGMVLFCEWWMDEARYEYVNDLVMGVIYSPLLVVTAFLEVKTAKRVRFNRNRNEVDEDTIEEWEQLSDEMDFESTGWAKRVEDTKPNVFVDETLQTVRALKQQMEEMKTLLDSLKQSGSAALG